jgi:hypothetical protein
VGDCSAREGSQIHGQCTIINAKPHELGCANVEGKDSKHINREEHKESSEYQGVRLHYGSRSESGLPGIRWPGRVRT